MQIHDHTRKVKTDDAPASFGSLDRKSDISRLLNKEQVRHETSFSMRKIDTLMAQRKIRYLKIGRSVRFYLPHVMEDLLKFERKAITI